MGLVIARRGPDLMSGDFQNVSSDYDGIVRLAPTTNLIPDPGFKDFNPTHDKLRYWDLGEPKRPTHWAPFVKDNNAVKYFSRQSDDLLPMSTRVFEQIDELIKGPSPLSDDRVIDIAPPIKPFLKAMEVGPIGYPAGYYAIAYGWILGDWKDSRRITGPGPRVPVTGDTPLILAQGQGLQIVPPTEIPGKVTGIAVFLCGPHASQAATLNLSNPMYLGMRIRKEGLEQFYRMRGPLFKRDPWANQNDTYIGDPTGGVKTWRMGTPYGRHEKRIKVRLGFHLVTESGRTPARKLDNWHTVEAAEASLHFKPNDFGGSAVEGWVPLVQFDVGDFTTKWYEIHRKEGGAVFPRGDDATIYVSRPSDWPDKSATRLKDSSSEAGEDKSGINPPSEPLEIPTILELNNSGLTMGKHLVKTAMYVGEAEGPASNESSITLPQGATNLKRAIRIHRPQWNNLLDNNDLADRDVVDIDLPRDWLIPGRPFATPSTLVVRPPRDGVIRYFDNTNDGTGTDFVAFRTPFATLSEDENRFLVRFKQKISGYTGGKVRVYLEEYPDGSDETTSPSQTTLIGSYSNNQEVTRVIRLSRQSSDPVRPDVIRVATSTRAIRIRVSGRGSATRIGVRNFDVEFSHWGAFEGWSEPTKANRLEQNRHDDNDGEREEHIYPHGGYCVVREDPKDGPGKPAYTVINSSGFESSTNGWTLSTTGATGLSMVRNEESGIHGSWGLMAKKSAVTPTSNLDRTYGTLTWTARANAAIAADMYVKQVSAHNVDLMALSYGDNTHIAVLELTSAGALNVVTFPSTGGTVVTNIANNVDAEEHLSVEMELIGAGTGSGQVKVYLGRHKADRLLVSTISVALTGRQVNRAYLGHTRLNMNKDAIYTLYFDKVLITQEGSTLSTDEPGNYIEYYAPPRTPKNEFYGPTGLKVPVKAEQQYTIGVNVWYDNLPYGTDLLRVRSMDKKHNILDVHGAVVPGINGDNKDWTRHTMTLTTPEDTAYIEFFANDLGAGTVKLHGLQLQTGAVATAFNMTNATSGYNSVYLRRSVPGLLLGDPMSRLEEILALDHINVGIEDEAGTSHTIQYRSGNTLTAVQAASYTSDWTTLDPTHTIVEVRVNFSSSSNTASSELRRIEMEIIRPDAIITDSEGQEYYGGALINNVSAVRNPPNSEEVLMASGRTVDNPWGTQRTPTISFDVNFFRRTSVEEFSEEKVHYLEFPDRKYRVELVEIPEFTPYPDSRINYSNREPFQRYAAEGVVARVISEDSR